MTKIEWADEVWNPVVGCSQVSPGCRNCYAERMAARLSNMLHPSTFAYRQVIEGGLTEPAKWNGKSAFRKSELGKPYRWQKPRRIFVCSMGDLFHESIPFEWIEQIWDVFFECPHHTFMVLTKRPKRMCEFVKWMNDARFRRTDYFNAWLGVTAENQQAADERISILLQIPAAARFVSVEPMLGLVDIKWHLGEERYISCEGCRPTPVHGNPDCPGNHLVGGLDWVICGGESGPGARPMHPDWARSLRDQCRGAEVPFFLKQWGEWVPFGKVSGLDKDHYYPGRGKCKTFRDGAKVFRVGKKKAGRLLDGETWDQLPQ